MQLMLPFEKGPLEKRAKATFGELSRTRSHGAIEAWNWQQPHWMKMVWRGDVVVGVNDASGCDDMLKECREARLLKLRLLRPCYQQPSGTAPDSEWHPSSWSVRPQARPCLREIWLGDLWC